MTSSLPKVTSSDPITQGTTRNLSARIQQEGERPELRGNNQVYIGHLLRMLSAMEDTLRVGVELVHVMTET